VCADPRSRAAAKEMACGDEIDLAVPPVNAAMKMGNKRAERSRTHRIGREYFSLVLPRMAEVLLDASGTTSAAGQAFAGGTLT